MKKEKIPEIIEKYEESLPRFHDGRIDYSNAKEAPTVVYFLKHENEILLLKRSSEVRTHKNMWSTVAGYLDELKPIVEKAFQEVKEETGIDRNKVSSITRGKPLRIEEDEKLDISPSSSGAERKTKNRTELGTYWVQMGRNR